MSSRGISQGATTPETVAARLLFITGTDTGVGKTVLCGMLLEHLRRSGVKALAIKPFCTGGRGDAKLLHRLMQGDATLDEINPFHFSEPLAPLVCARQARKTILFQDVVQSVNAMAGRADFLLVEGAGGLCSPLGEGFGALELIGGLGCNALVVAPNRLGTINHTLLAFKALQSATRNCSRPAHAPEAQFTAVLMGVAHPDLSARFNLFYLKELLPNIRVLGIPFLSRRANTAEAVKENARKLYKVLARIWRMDTV